MGKREHDHQIAALPVRLGPPGQPEILLITSRERHRWIIPKGWPMKGKADHEAAAIEAYEEAGLTGAMGERPIGSFQYRKFEDGGHGEAVRVDVYLMRVEAQRADWPERDQRMSLWCDIDETLIILDEPDLARLISSIRDQLA